MPSPIRPPIKFHAPYILQIMNNKRKINTPQAFENQMAHRLKTFKVYKN